VISLDREIVGAIALVALVLIWTCAEKSPLMRNETRWFERLLLMLSILVFIFMPKPREIPEEKQYCEQYPATCEAYYDAPLLAKPFYGYHWR